MGAGAPREVAGVDGAGKSQAAGHQACWARAKQAGRSDRGKGTVAPKAVVRRADGWPLDQFAVIERAWVGETVVCIGGGPSLTQAQVDACRGFHVIAVNDAYRLAPWADICYFADGQWFEWHKDRPEFRDFPGIKVSISGNERHKITDDAVLILNNYGGEEHGVLSQRANGIATGQNGGYQAINIAYLAGAARVLLLGYDMRGTHWFGEHPRKTVHSHYATFIGRFARLAKKVPRGFEIINCTPGSALTCFPRMDLEQALAGVLADQKAAALPA
jgi:hypothetical protein